jgi:hypothetical protein
VVSSPVLALLALVIPLLLWLGLLAAGLDHVPQGLPDLIAIPPIGSFFDFNLALELAGLQLGGLALIAVALTAVRALIWAILIGLVLEWLDGERPSPVGALRGILRFPSVFAIVTLDLALVFFAQTLGGSLGSFGSLAFFAGLVGGLYFLVFAPVAAVRDRIPAREAIRRSVRAARLPGSRHVGVVLLYFTVAFLPFMVLPGPFVANPSVGRWAYVLVTSLVHLGFYATFAYRYVAVEDQIPEAAPRQARGTRPRRRLF